MSLLNLSKYSCPTNPENQVVLVCMNQYCQFNRLVCTKCLINHTAHANELVDQKVLENKIKQTQEEDHVKLLKELNSLFDDLNTQYTKLKLSIQKKFDISITRVINMNTNQLNEFLNQLQQYSRQENDLKSIIKEASDTFKVKLNECQKILQLQQLNYIELSKEEIENANKLYKQGYQYYLNQDYANAIKYFDQALEINSQHLESLEYKGESLRLMNKYQESLFWLDKALEIDPKQKVALFNKGASLRMLGQYQESLVWTDKALEIDPKYINALYSKGESLRMLGQYQESLVWIDKVLEIDPKYIYALYNKGESLRGLGQYQESIVWFDKALEIDPKYKFALRTKGESLRMLNKYKEALEFLNKALEIDNNYQFALQSKGACLIELGNLDEAEVCLNKASKIDPNDQFAINQLKILKEKKK